MHKCNVAKCHGHVDANVADTYVNMGSVEDSRGNFQEALEYFEKALDIYLKSYGRAHVNVAITKENTGHVYKHLGDLAHARSCFDEAYSIFVQVLGPDHHNTRKAAHALQKL